MINPTRLCIAALLAVAAPAWAVPPLVIGDVPTADPGTLEVYAGVERVRDGAVEWATPATELVLGLTSRQEITLELPILVEPGARGPGDLVLGTKVVLLPEAAGRPGLAASLEWKLASGDRARGLGSGSNELGLLLRAQEGRGPVTLIVNAGAALVGDVPAAGGAQPRRPTLFLGGGGEGALGRGLSVLADLYWQRSDTPGAPARAAADLGLAFRFTEHLKLHGAVGSSVRPDALGGPGLRLYAGMKGELGMF